MFRRVVYGHFFPCVVSVNVVVVGFRCRRLSSVFPDSPYGVMVVAVLSVRWGLSFGVVLLRSCAGLCGRGFWCRVRCNVWSRV